MYNDHLVLVQALQPVQAYHQAHHATPFTLTSDGFAFHHADHAFHAKYAHGLICQPAQAHHATSAFNDH